MSSRTVAALSLVAALLAGCNTVGPRAVRTARGDYNHAIVDTWNEQLLLNLVRLRYRDTPFFLEVTGVSTQYIFDGSVSAGGVFGDPDLDATAGLGIGYSERPTVTYTPLTGEKFVKQLLSPIPLETLFLLPQAGWSVERVLRCCVQSLNGIPNAPSAAGPTPDYEPRFEDFHRLAAALRRLQVAGQLVFGVRGDAAAPEYVVRIGGGGDGDADVASEARELRRRLGLPAGRGEVRLRPATLDPRPGELALGARSLMGVMYYFSQAVEPPERHAAAGLVTVTRDAAGAPFDWRAVTGDLLRVRSAAERPAAAFVAVRYRGAWFYIADDDLGSKSSFGLLTQLFSLQAGDSRALLPVLTLPVGG